MPDPINKPLTSLTRTTQAVPTESKAGRTSQPPSAPSSLPACDAVESSGGQTSVITSVVSPLAGAFQGAVARTGTPQMRSPDAAAKFKQLLAGLGGDPIPANAANRFAQTLCAVAKYDGDTEVSLESALDSVQVKLSAIDQSFELKLPTRAQPSLLLAVEKMLIDRLPASAQRRMTENGLTTKVAAGDLTVLRQLFGSTIAQRLALRSSEERLAFLASARTESVVSSDEDADHGGIASDRNASPSRRSPTQAYLDAEERGQPLRAKLGRLAAFRDSIRQADQSKEAALAQRREANTEARREIDSLIAQGKNPDGVTV